LNKNLFKKAKGPFLISSADEKFYNLSTNSNILGYSYKKLTSIVKNNISTSWNINAETIYHARLKKLFEKIFTKDYYAVCCPSLEDFFYRSAAFHSENFINFKISGTSFQKWFDSNVFIKNNSNADQLIDLIDMTELYLQYNGNNSGIEIAVNKINNGKYKILNYFWYPVTDIKLYNSDIIILPEIYSGNFNFIFILIKKDSVLYKNLNTYLSDINTLSSLYISSSLTNYYLIKKNENKKILKLNWNGIKQVNRLFTAEDLSDYKKYKKKYILLNENPPYYNYLPIILEEYQYKYLKRIKL